MGISLISAPIGAVHCASHSDKATLLTGELTFTVAPHSLATTERETERRGSVGYEPRLMPLTHEYVYTFSATRGLQDYDDCVRRGLTPR